MARLLFPSDKHLIDNALIDPKIISNIGVVDTSNLDMTNTLFYISDDGNDIAIFDRIDIRIHMGHNLFRSPIITALRNAKEIIDLHWKLNPNLEIIAGLTPYDNRATRLFNRKLGFKMIMVTYNNKNELCYRYELRRDKCV